jgi:hypothetical protein
MICKYCGNEFEPPNARRCICDEYPPCYGVLCRNCNSAKHEHGECPHERERREAAA